LGVRLSAGKLGIGAVLLCGLLGGMAHAAPPRDGSFYGMALAQANALLEDALNYELAYRVDTPSTADIFVRFQQHTLYLGHFLDGECVSVEKRAVVSAEAMQGMFDAYRAKLGAPGEGADSTDSRSHYAKWVWPERVLELSASARSDGSYLLSHEEYDPERMREAVLLQQRELREQPQQADPLTGQPLPLSRQPGQQAAAANGASPGDPAWEEALPAEDSAAADSAAPPAGQADDAADKPEAEDDKKKDKEPPPDITGKNDWEYNMIS
jgi:hypothetical protein